MKYQIKAEYETGDSFGHQSTLTILELEWEDLSVAKANLQRIKDHYTQYEILNKWNVSRDTIEKTLESNKDKDWFVKSEQVYAVKGNSRFVITDTIKDIEIHEKMDIK